MSPFFRGTLLVTSFIIAIATPTRARAFLDPDLQVQPLFDCCPSGFPIDVQAFS